MDEPMGEARLGPRTLVTLAIAASFAIGAAIVQVPTSLGVEAPRPVFGEPDLSSSEYIWRVWWRARDNLINVNPQWLVTGSLLALLAVFAAGTLAAIWIVTGPPTDDDLTTTDG